MRTVPPAEWAGTLGALKADGYLFLDFLAGVDRIESIEVIAHVVDPATVARVLISTRVPADGARLPSVVSIFAGADWHEREASEMFGIVFDGHPDARPLLLRTPLGSPPLLRSTVLAARVVTPWPGAADLGTAGRGSRRRQQPPGVPDSWLTDGGS